MILPKNFHPTLTKTTHTAAVVNVPLGNRSYPIYIGTGLLQRTGVFFRRHGISKKIVIITDTTVARLYLRVVTSALQKSGFTVCPIIIPPGENQKKLRRAERIFTKLLKWNIDRSATIVALGGGVIGDLAGFVAATYQRGIALVQIPTTFLAQVDSSIGGKVGVNHVLAKNMIGAFYQPKFVLADTSVLKTLPRREIVCGLGEVIKYGIILDKKFFSFTEKNLSHALRSDTHVLQSLVKRSCQLKAYVVSRDEREGGFRAILNFGHTIGHALEHAGGYSYLKHGEAILYGMVGETHIARSCSMITATVKERVEQCIAGIPLPKLSSLKISFSSLVGTMLMDKKTKNGMIRMVLPYSIGKVSLPIAVSVDSIHAAVKYVKEHVS